jgi:AdoMet-dependent rRNA methyltransferase SPB1
VLRRCAALICGGVASIRAARAAAERSCGGRAFLAQVLPPGGLFDVVVCDGAPNVGGAWSSEAYSQAALVLDACKLATEFLAPRGLFLTKVFRSAEYHALLYAFGQLFERVESTKPVASRSTSAEIYVACHGYRAPGRLDRRLLDPAHLFAPTEDGGGGGGGAMADGAGAPGRDVVHGPEAPRRNRGGYDENLRGVLWRAADAETSFISAEKPAEALGAFGALTIAPKSDLDTHAATTAEVRAALADLRVLAKRDFRTLLRWRQVVLKGRAADAKAAAS